MNAFELYEAAFDSACEEYIPATREEKIQYVIGYADNAFDKPVNVTKEIAEKIVDCHLDWYAQTWGEEGNGHITNNMYHLVEAKLEGIEL